MVQTLSPEAGRQQHVRVSFGFTCFYSLIAAGSRGDALDFLPRKLSSVTLLLRALRAAKVLFGFIQEHLL